MSIWKRRREREETIEVDIAEARKVREETIADRVTVARAVASWRRDRPDTFGNDLEDTFNRRPRHAS